MPKNAQHTVGFIVTFNVRCDICGRTFSGTGSGSPLRMKLHVKQAHGMIDPLVTYNVNPESSVNVGDKSYYKGNKLAKKL